MPHGERGAIPLEPDRLAMLRRWSRLLDNAFRIPGTGIRFGWDPILGLFPGIGDLITPLFSILLLTHAFTVGVPRIVQLRMATNVALDFLVGFVPLLGDFFDVAWKANTKNLELLERHATGEARASTGDWIFVSAILAALAVLALAPIVAIAWLVSRFGVR